MTASDQERLIETAAKAAWERAGYSWAGATPADKDDCRHAAAAMLAVVVPLIREQIAAEIEAIPVVYPHGGSRYAFDVRSAAVRVARGEDR